MGGSAAELLPRSRQLGEACQPLSARPHAETSRPAVGCELSVRRISWHLWFGTAAGSQAAWGAGGWRRHPPHVGAWPGHTHVHSRLCGTCVRVRARALPADLSACVQCRVRELEEKCRTQSEQFHLLSQDLEKFRQHAGKIDLLGGAAASLDVPVAPGKPRPPFMNGLATSIAKGECWSPSLVGEECRAPGRLRGRLRGRGWQGARAPLEDTGGAGHTGGRGPRGLARCPCCCPPPGSASLVATLRGACFCPSSSPLPVRALAATSCCVWNVCSPQW